MPFVDPEQVRAALSNDPAAVRSLVEHMKPVVQARVARALGRRVGFRARDLASDIADFTQEVFMALFSDDARALRRWDPARGLSFQNFVGLLAQHRVAEILRTKRWSTQAEKLVSDESQIREAVAEPAADSEDASMSQELLGRLLERLESTLSTRGLEMFERLYVRGESIEQVCAETGLRSNAVHQWRSRIAKAARNGLQALEIEQDALSSSSSPMPNRQVRPPRAVRRAK
jgi:RNA polymerase sigma factor (sigma-70 family)